VAEPVTPRCRHHAECGGCGWQDVAYPEQLRRKQRLVEELLRSSLGRDAPRVRPTVGMPVGPDGMPWGFRHKAAFVFGPGPGGRGLAMGHFARGGARIVPVEECPVHADGANRVAFALRDALQEVSAELVRHAIVRTSADGSQAVALLVVTRNARALRDPVRRLLASRARPDGVLLNLNDRPGPYMLGRVTLRVAGREHVVESALGPEFLVSPAAFFQTNVTAAGELLRLVREALPPRQRLRVLDLFAGSGLFALPLALAGHSVVAVEENRQAVRDGIENARRNAAHLRYVCARVEAALPRLSRERFDAVVLDPPRQGCPPRVLEAVCRLGAERLVLVSCNPEALARELPLALRAGYGAVFVQPVDMFPHTPHVEAVALLRRRPAVRSRRIGRTR